MTLEFEIDDTVSPALRDVINQKLPTARQQMVHQLAGSVLEETARRNPVASGRSRAGWEAAAQQLAGDQRTGASASGEGTLHTNHDQTTTSVSATNQVPYIAYLEYGTSKMAPFAMLRNALSRIPGQLGNFFRLGQR